MYFIVMAGVKQAAFLNNIGVIGKLIPLAIFILILLFRFDFSVFFYRLLGQGRHSQSDG